MSYQSQEAFGEVRLMILTLQVNFTKLKLLPIIYLICSNRWQAGWVNLSTPQNLYLL